MGKSLEQIEVGDKVWVGSGTGNADRVHVQTVARLTPTLIILDGRYVDGAKSEFNRYRRRDFWQMKGGWFKDRINAIATPEECAQYEAAQKKKADEAAARQREEDARKAKRDELNALLPERAYVQDTHTNLEGEWQLCVYASEDEVRRLAEVLSGIVN